MVQSLATKLPLRHPGFSLFSRFFTILSRGCLFLLLTAYKCTTNRLQRENRLCLAVAKLMMSGKHMLVNSQHTLHGTLPEQPNFL